jgi:hypothetical protein
MPRKSISQEIAYKGDLIKPIRIDASPLAPTLLTGANDKLAKDQYILNLQKKLSDDSLFILEERLRKLGLLLEHYKISKDHPDKWLHLALGLAVDRVAGFRVENAGQRPGSPKKWDAILLAKLYFDIEKALKGSKKRNSVHWACTQLAKDKSWKSLIKSEKALLNPRFLHNKYLEAKKSEFVLFFLNLQKDERVLDVAADIPSLINLILTERA